MQLLVYVLFTTALAAVVRVAPADEPLVIEARPQPRSVQIFESKAGAAILRLPVQKISPNQFEAFDPDRAGVLREYDLQEIHRAEYRLPGGERIHAELFRAQNFASAYGLYSFSRPLESASAALGGEGSVCYLSRQEAGLWQGNYFLRVSSEDLGRNPEVEKTLREIASTLSRRLVVRPSELPPVVRALPEEALVPGSKRFIAGPLGLERFAGYDNPGDLWLLTGEGSEAAIGDYGPGPAHLIIAEYHTPQLANDAAARVSAYLDTLPAGERTRRIFKREGNYLICASEVGDIPTMLRIVDQIRYRRIVQWLKPDPPVPPIDDGSLSAISYYLTTFRFMGIVLLVTIGAGILVGGAMFLYRRRRLGMMPGFSDAGGMLRLNLDALVAPSARKERERLMG